MNKFKFFTFLLSVMLAVSSTSLIAAENSTDAKKETKVVNSKFDYYEKLKPLNRILDFSDEGYGVWGCAPIWGDDGLVHVFFARYKGIINYWSESAMIIHATAKKPEGPYTVHDVVVGRHYDRKQRTEKNEKDESYLPFIKRGVLNPRIYKQDGKYYLFYTITSGCGTDFNSYHSIGLLVSDDLWKWKNAGNEKGEVLAPAKGDKKVWYNQWVNNPSYACNPKTKEHWLYFRGSGVQPDGKTTYHDSIGLAVAKKITGPYKIRSKPVIDTNNDLVRNIHGKSYRGLEDPYVWHENGSFHMLVHDLGYNPDEEGGLYFHSKDGIHWDKPGCGFRGTKHYWDEYSRYATLKGYGKGRIETPIVLWNKQQSKVTHLFVNRDSNKRASGFVFKIIETQK